MKGRLQVRQTQAALRAFIDSQRDPVAARAKQLATGFRAIDREMVLERGNLVVVGADTGVGKSLFCECLAMFSAIRGKRVVHFHLEDGEAEVERRLGGLLLGCPPHLAERFQLDPSLLERAEGALPRYDTIRWAHVHHVRDLEVMIDVMRRHSPDMIVVDYVQELRAPTEDRDLRQHITRCVDALQEASRETGAITVLASQLARPDGRKETVEPNKHHLKEAGAIGERADKLFLLWRESWDAGAPTWVKCGKDKSGSGTGRRWRLGFDRNTGGFFDDPRQ